AALEGARLVFGSRYLLGIAGLLGFYELVSNIVDFQLAVIVEREVAGALERDAFFGMVGQITGIASIAAQLFLTTYVLNRFGVKTALLFLPVVVLGGSIGFLVVPSLFFAAFMRVGDNALNYSINQSAREALYTPTSQDAKYKAKAFIDMFVQRAAKVVAVGLNLGLTAVAAVAVRWLSLLSAAAIAGWIVVIRYLGDEFRERSGEED
ncbi:MAG: Npt1/Npt2 family nucleotide transporter, partial [Gemmatimonadota bacterium]|nr:Npt1/Npt2 family nucleotide transporter [Gemmatimonadota bacterium]